MRGKLPGNMRTIILYRLTSGVMYNTHQYTFWWLCRLISPLDKMAAMFADDIYKCAFMNEKLCILIRISLKFVPKSSIDNKSALVQVMAGHRKGDKPVSKSMLTQLKLTHVGSVITDATHSANSQPHRVLVLTLIMKISLHTDDNNCWTFYGLK